MSASLNKEIPKKFLDVAEAILATSKSGGKTIFAGNGGSAAMASHVSVDLTKTAGIRSVNFNEADLLTCFSNDYGYENWLSKSLEFYADSNDFVVLISSSGSSPNMLNAAKFCQRSKILSPCLQYIAAALGHHRTLARGKTSPKFFPSPWDTYVLFLPTSHWL
mgnify:CR=1 FL=1